MCGALCPWTGAAVLGLISCQVDGLAACVGQEAHREALCGPRRLHSPRLPGPRSGQVGRAYRVDISSTGWRGASLGPSTATWLLAGRGRGRSGVLHASVRPGRGALQCQRSPPRVEGDFQSRVGGACTRQRKLERGLRSSVSSGSAEVWGVCLAHCCP